MTRRTETMSSDYFDRLYETNPDPWDFRSSSYEQEKYTATLSALTKPRYAKGLEVGCSIGVFTKRLAERCESLLAIDASDVALDAARATCLHRPHVTFERRMVPHQFPEGQFDLIVLSEVLYYLAPDDLAVAATRCVTALAAGGDLILCHWLGETDYPLTGAQASELFAHTAVTRLSDHRVLADVSYRLERFSHPSTERGVSPPRG